MYIKHFSSRCRAFLFVFTSLFVFQHGYSQVTFPVNGIADPREGCYAFLHATLVKDPETTIPDATLVIRKGKIIAAGAGKIAIPEDAVSIDCSGKYIYPSFIDLYTDYGVPLPQRSAAFDFRGPTQLHSATRGAYNWNQAIRPETDAFRLFTADNSKAKNYRDIGFGTVLSHQKDGIARGTGVVVTLADKADNLLILKEKASMHLSMSKGSSTQSYPTSLMGSIALLRQTYLDGQWYKNRPAAGEVNLSLEAWVNNQSLPQIFDADNKWNVLRADRIGDEFGIQYIIRAGGDEYQRIREMADTKASFIVHVNYPQAFDVEDPADARFIALRDLKHWELAPSNPAAFEKANINFCLTTAELKDIRQFKTNLRKAFDFGLTEKKALDALTRVPAKLIGIYDSVGSIDPGKIASFIITSGPVFDERTIILQNWVQGQRYVINELGWNDIKGRYALTLQSPTRSMQYNLDIRPGNQARIISGDTLTVKLNSDGKFIRLSFPESKKSTHPIRLTGTINGETWNGIGEDSAGNRFSWSAVFKGEGAPRKDSVSKKIPLVTGKVNYPFGAYGWDSLPQQETILIKHATIWTNEQAGILQDADILVKNGKIARIGKNISQQGARTIDATGKHVTPGIIDEHSHIATASINEAGQSVTSEVRIADNLNPEDINIYRQLSGGVTSSHILHGSANTIGGQTQLIKLRWGANDEGIKFSGADPFIKFALGENVKRTTSSNNNRFPDTRMGVEELLSDAFQRAKDYRDAWKAVPAGNSKKSIPGVSLPRKDLELDALVEILDNKRFITCHSYVQSEITALLRVADKYGFKVNTFTHILEGYKVADKMKAHGSNASTFSDWWAYKTEVQDAIPYNASLMQQMGLNVCINSDDPEMARRLNQEAAKSVKYGGMSEEDALKMVTLNPAKALHIQDRVGSLREGKDADLVIWSDHPLSIYAKAEQTIVDGIIYFDRNRDLLLRKEMAVEKNRLIQKMLGEKRGGAPVQAPLPSYQVILSCGDHDHQDHMITVHTDEMSQSNQ